MRGPLDCTGAGLPDRESYIEAKSNEKELKKEERMGRQPRRHLVLIDRPASTAFQGEQNASSRTQRHWWTAQQIG